MDFIESDKDNTKTSLCINFISLSVNICLISVCQRSVNDSAKTLEAGEELPSASESICAPDSTAV